MAPVPPNSRKKIPALTIPVILSLVLILAASGCTQSSSAQSSSIQSSTTQSDSTQNPVVTATQTDATHIVMQFNGGPGMEKLMELQTTVTDSKGESKTQATGSRLATTPVQTGGTSKFTGSFDGDDHVVVYGYFSDGSQQLLLDTYI